MRTIEEVEKDAIARKGGRQAVETSLTYPKDPTELAEIPDDRWLSVMTKCVFQAGFSMRVIENKWPRFEEVFEGFDVGRWSLMSDGDLDSLLKAEGIVRHGGKISSVGRNAAFLSRVSAEHGGVGTFFAGWQRNEYCHNLRHLQKNTARLGGRTAQVFLRRMGVDTLVFTPDVVRALQQEGIVSRLPSSAGDFAALQAAIDTWSRESPRSLNEISQILAFSVD